MKHVVAVGEREEKRRKKSGGDPAQSLLQVSFYLVVFCK